VVIVFTGHNIWLVLLFLLATALFFYFLPSLIDLKQVSKGLRVQGPVTNEELQLEMRCRPWKSSEVEETVRFSPFYYLCVVLLMVLFTLILFRLLR